MLKRIFVLCVCLMFLLCSCVVKPDHEQPTTEPTAKDQPESPDSLQNEATPEEGQDNVENPITEEPEALDWKAAYLAYIEANKDIHLSYELVFMDGDDIPELYSSGVAEAFGDGICAYKNGQVVEQRLNRIGGGRYIERSGNIINQNGNMGVYYTTAFKLTEDGFEQTFSAVLVEKAVNIENDDFELVYEYYLEYVPVSESEYQTAVEASFDFEASVRLGENAVAYDSIVQQITNWE